MAPFTWRSYNPILVFLCLTAAHIHASEVIPGTDELVYNGFFKADLNLDGRALLVHDLLSLTNMPYGTSGHAFCSYPLSFQKIPGGPVSSFSTTFVVAIGFQRYKGHGLAFMLSSKNDLSDNLPAQFIGLPSSRSDDHVFFAVELDTVLNPEFMDADNNHVGINLNSLLSVESHTAGFYDSGGDFQRIELRSGNPVQVWLDYDSKSYRLNITLAPHSIPKPELPLLSTTLNLSSLLSSGSLCAGFSAASDKLKSDHYVLGWSFKLDGEAQPLDYSQLPLELFKHLKQNAQFQYQGVLCLLSPMVIPAVVLIVVAVLICYHLRNTEEDKEFEIMCGPPSFAYKELFTATNGFDDKMLLGKGGFGSVYEGVLPNSGQSIAIKKVSPESKQGKREFMAEIAILGRVRHHNLVQLLGYCRYKKELLLVYDYMPNGSLDNYLYNKGMPVLEWDQRLRIIKDVASGLCHLHEDWERVIIHRDIKASNVLLDKAMNGRFSDFGLARLHDHGADAHTTHVAGTWGYIAPDELARLGKATKVTDVFAFGIFMMEVVCRRRPIGMAIDGGEAFVLADWVLSRWKSGSITGAVDPKLEDYDQEEAEVVLKLGLLCSHTRPRA